MLVPLPALAGDDQSWERAEELGRILGSEEFCGLTFDQNALAEFIRKNVKEDDTEFASNLNLTTGNAKRETKDMNASQKTALCVQITRTAKNFSFTR
jgi:hypothetical protein